MTKRKTSSEPKAKRQAPKSQFQINQEIEQLVTSKGTNPNEYTSDEKLFLTQYEGYGGIEVESLQQAKGSFTEFYTPDPIVQKMWALAYKYGYKKEGSVLEPACGTGRFLKYVSSITPFTGYEISPISFAIAKILYPNGNILNDNFETAFIRNNSTVRANYTGNRYDLVIGNPPYGKANSKYMGMGEMRYTGAGDWINYFITRGLDMLNPGGLLVYIIGTEVMNGGTPWLQQETSAVKADIMIKADLLDAYRLPVGVFANTGVLTDIIVLRKK